MKEQESALRLGSCAYFCAIVTLTTARFGSTPDRFLYQSFLLLLPVAVLALWMSSRRGGTRPWVLALVGVLLLAQAGLQPATEAFGYVLASLGWAGLVCGFWLASEVRCSRWLVFSLLGIGILEASLGLIQSVGGIDRIGSYPRDLGAVATGTFINRNHFAGLLNMVIGLGVGMLYFVFAHGRAGSRSENYARSWIAIMVCAILGLALALSLSRAGVLILIASIAFVAALLWGRRRSGARGLPARAAVLLLLATLGLVLAYGADALLGRFSEFTEGGRPQAYEDTLRLIGDHPWLGVGPGMYRWHFRAYQTGSVDKVYTHAHNDYLQVAAEWGLPLALAGWGFVSWRFYRNIRLFLETRDPWRGGLGLGCAAATLSILLHSLLDFNLHIPSNLLFFTTVLGVGWAAEQQAGTEPTPVRRATLP